MINPEETYREMEKAREELAKAHYNWTLLDEDKKSVLAVLELKYAPDCKTQAEVERYARADEEYREYVKGLAEAKKALESAKARWVSLQALNENKRSKEATERLLANRG